MARPADHPGGGHLFFGAGSPARVDTRFSEWGLFNRKPWWSTRPSGRDFVVVIGNGVGGRRANNKKRTKKGQISDNKIINHRYYISKNINKSDFIFCS